MRFSVLATGSKANCTYIETESTRILIDCGLSCKQTSLRLEGLEINPESLSGILVTHEHSDHIKGISVMSRKYKIPVYANHDTGSSLENIFCLKEFRTGEEFCLGDMTIEPFSIVHDAADPVGFMIVGDGEKFVQATDIGKITSLIRYAFSKANGIVIESNYDNQMLRECQYPWLLKQRIGSSHGHLSNAKCAEFIREINHDGLKHVVLGHLSENSNCPERTIDAMAEQLAVEQFDTFVCGNAATATPLYNLAGDANLKVAV